MTEKELKRLSRRDLLEMLITQSVELREAQEKVKQLEAELSSRQIKLENAGSIAEASLSLNGVFEAAQASCEQYIQNIRACSEAQDEICARREAESIEKAARLLQETEERCATLRKDAETYCVKLKADAEQECKAMIQQRLKEVAPESTRHTEPVATEKQCWSWKWKRSKGRGEKSKNNPRNR